MQHIEVVARRRLVKTPLISVPSVKVASSDASRSYVALGVSPVKSMPTGVPAPLVAPLRVAFQAVSEVSLWRRYTAASVAAVTSTVAVAVFRPVLLALTAVGPGSSGR